jgi:hypothetical protein
LERLKSKNPNNMRDLQQLQEQFLKTEKLYKEIKAATEANILTWFWATDSIFKLEPFYFEQHRFPKGKRLLKEPAKRANKYHYGLNDVNEIIVERQYCGFENEIYYETFFDRSSSEIETCRFDYGPDKLLINLMLFIFKEGILVQHFHIVKKGWSIYNYCYKGKNLIKKMLKHEDPDSHVISERIYEYNYDQYGFLDNIKEGEYFWYKKPNKKTSFDQLTEQAQDKLLEAIKSNIHKYKVKEKLFCLFINYGNQNYFPPSIAFGRQQEREKWLAEGEMAKWVIWNPAEYASNFDMDLDIETANFFDLYNQETDMLQKDHVARKAILNVTIKIKECLPEFGFNRTDDFVIIASDYELADFRKNFKILNPDFLSLYKEVLP